MRVRAKPVLGARAAAPNGVDLLTESFKAYRHGLLAKIPTGKRPAASFPELIFHSLFTLPLEQRTREFHSARRFSLEGLGLARKGDHVRAAEAFTAAQRDLERLEPGSGPHLLATAAYEAAAAYLDHREKRFANAEARVDRAFEANLELEREHDVSLMMLNRVQLAHNQSRIWLAMGRRNEAFELCGELIAFLEGRAETVSIHRDWCPKRRRSLSGHLVRLMIGQIAGEAASFITTGKSEPAEWDRFLEKARPSAPDGYTRNAQVAHGLCARKALCEGDRDLAFDHLRSLLYGGPKHCPGLFYSGLVWLHEACRSVDTRRSHQLADMIERDSSKWRGFNPFLRARLERSAQRAGGTVGDGRGGMPITDHPPTAPLGGAGGGTLDRGIETTSRP